MSFVGEVGEGRDANGDATTGAGGSEEDVGLEVGEAMAGKGVIMMSVVQFDTAVAYMGRRPNNGR